jgi:exopolysaccharide biosynthesis WecB/TagA/CpsF family protein
MEQRLSLTDRLGNLPQVRMAGLTIAAIGMEETADLMIEAALTRRWPGGPYVLTSANGEVISRCHRDPELAELFRSADMISADGQPMVFASRLRRGPVLPERVATTDLFHAVARRAVRKGVTFYLFGASESENRRAFDNVVARYPSLMMLGRSHGYLAGTALDDKIDEINALAPDILWLGLGVPREQLLARNLAPRLPRVGVIKTAGGLFNFISGSRVRAPAWMQAAGLEWSWRLAQEPRRLFWRYAMTNPHACYLLLTGTGRAEAEQ